VRGPVAGAGRIWRRRTPAAAVRIGPHHQIGLDGRQLQANLQPPGLPASSDTRLKPLSDGRGANWSHRPYFRKALSRPGKVQVTGPYLSLPDAMMCISLSIVLGTATPDGVLCCDLAWSKPFHR